MADSRLSDLPKELRLLILEHLFADNTPVVIGSAPPKPWHGKPQRYHPAISEVCRELRREALPIFYRRSNITLLLRYREGRMQVQQWITEYFRRPEFYRRIEQLSIQYCEEAYRSTSLLINLRDLRVVNRDRWLHPLTEKPFRLLCEMEKRLADFKLSECDNLETSAKETCELLQTIFDSMVETLQRSLLLRSESMASIRLRGRSDFELRFAVINSVDN